jgi:hypothetical protein
MVTKTALITQANTALTDYQSQVKELKQEQTNIISEIDTIKNQLNLAIDDLVKRLVPNLEPESLAHVSQVLGLYMQEWYDRKTELNRINIKLIEELDANPDYKNAVLNIDETTGTLVVERAETAELITQTKVQMNNITMHPDFQEFYDSRNQDIGVFGLIANNFNGVNFRKKAMLELTGYDNFDQMVSSVDVFKEGLATLEIDLSTLESEINRIKSIVNQMLELTTSVLRFDEDILPDVQAYVNNYIQRSESLAEVRVGLDKPTRILITTVIALKAKILVLTKSYNFVNSEIITRERTKNNLFENIQKWTKSSKTEFDLDSEKYLVTTPRSYNMRSSLVLNSSRSVRTRTVSYVNYEAYDNSLDLHPTVPFWGVVKDEHVDNIPNYMLEKMVPDYNPETYSQFLTDASVAEMAEPIDFDASEIEFEDFNFTEPEEEEVEELTDSSDEGIDNGYDNDDDDSDDSSDDD